MFRFLIKLKMNLLSLILHHYLKIKVQIKNFFKNIFLPEKQSYATISFIKPDELII
jgi:hypothetical protein